MAEHDLIALQGEWNDLHRKVLAGAELNKAELQRAIELTRILRQTNTGPARKRKTASKVPLTKSALDSLLKG